MLDYVSVAIYNPAARRAPRPPLICQARVYPINFHRSLTRVYRTRRATGRPAVRIDQSPVTRGIQLIFTRAARHVTGAARQPAKLCTRGD